MLLPYLHNKLYRVTRWAGDSSTGDVESKEPTESLKARGFTAVRLPWIQKGMLCL